MRYLLILIGFVLAFSVNAQTLVDTLEGDETIYFTFTNCKTITAEVDTISAGNGIAIATLEVSTDNSIWVPAVFMQMGGSEYSYTGMGAVNSEAQTNEDYGSDIDVEHGNDISWALFTNNYKYQRIKVVGTAGDTIAFSVTGVKRRWGD